MLPANTPERQAKLRRLPSNEFVRQDRGTEVTYTYADPMVCHCLYVGSEPDYKKFRQVVVGDIANFPTPIYQREMAR